MQRVVVVSGACGVGKSEAVRSMRAALGDLVGEIAVLETDDFYKMIDPHWTRPPARVDRYYEISGWLLSETVLGFLRFGFDWVAIATNGAWQEERARTFVHRFAEAGVDVHHITLDPGEDEITRRTGLRAQATDNPLDHDAADVAVDFLLDVRSHSGPWTYVIDNRDLTPAATALAIHEAVTLGCGRL